MVSASLRSTTFLLLFILLPLRFSSAHTQNQGKKTMVVDDIQTTKSRVDLEVYHGVPAVAETDQRTRFLSGRKMMSNEVHSKLKAKGLTTCVVGNCNNHEEVLKVKQKQHKVGKRNINGHSSMSGLVPLNADYYVPRPHPPKNN
ncbi:uncharacterized protein LOC114179587 isoform X2 [Vigna unguiculata]|uniref:Uncharacterized protein n=1 Tax=Vigna unguiculata TaxID=3917 RepID=A0A4D6KVK7_VIGUN|nr:uncharacterized protein LOC114179587 isoform X2 [Vigna unguiculata]QCD80780.1 hypothetical protein DEO72_LG2g1103 [Vigna unguiculata]